MAFTRTERLVATEAVAVVGAPHVGEWHTFDGARRFSFFARQQSAGSPVTKVEVDISPWRTDDPTFPAATNYLTVTLEPTLTAVWNGTDGDGGWEKITSGDDLLEDDTYYHASPIKAMRARITPTVADVTYFDLVVSHDSP